MIWKRLYAEAGIQRGRIIAETRTLGFLSADSWSLFVTAGRRMWFSGGEGFWQFEEQITYTSPPLEDNWAASQLYTAGKYTYKYKQTNAGRERVHVCVSEDTFDNRYNTMETPPWKDTRWWYKLYIFLLYLLLSFCTSLSSSSFSLVMKLCRTGISNLIYCATWWKGSEIHRPSTKKETNERLIQGYWRHSGKDFVAACCHTKEVRNVQLHLGNHICISILYLKLSKKKKKFDLHHMWLLLPGLLPWGKPCRPAHMDPALLSAPEDSHCASISHALKHQPIHKGID